MSPRRRQHHAEHRLARLDQGDVDRELAVFAQELLGAIERVDQPERAVGDLRHVACGDRLLRDHRNLGSQLGEPGEDHRLGGLVGGGHRRGVGLGAHRHVAVVVLEDHRAGALGQHHDLGQQMIQILHHRSAMNSRST